MATCSKYEQGYDDNRFEIVVSERFHCSVCLLVLKDPVMCKNQHYYCSSCIKEHLANSEFCPTCREHLSVDTLIQVPRIVTDYLSELNICCDFYPRGCREVIQLSNLKRHVTSCGFSPVQCSNDGCNVLVNKRDKLHHEAEACDFRKSKCHDCGQLKKEVKEMKDEILHRQDQMKDEMKEVKDGMNEMKIEIKEMKGNMKEVKVAMNGMKSEMKNEIKDEMKEMKDEMSKMKGETKEMIDQVLARQGQLEDKMAHEIKEEIKNQIKNAMKGIKEEMKNEMKEIVMNAVRDAMAGKKDLEDKLKNSKQSSLATCSSNVRENIIVAGGVHKEGHRFVRNKCTECFNWADQTWNLLNSAWFDSRSSLCSFFYQGQMVVAGGLDSFGNKTNTMKCLNVADPAATWKDFAFNLPFKCSGHQVVNHHDRLFIHGGGLQATKSGQSIRSNAVNEMHLLPPYSSKILTRLTTPRSNHGMELFDNKLFILGGDDGKVTNSVVQYDLMKNEYKKMPPLPYAVRSLATVLWRNNVLVIGGSDEYDATLNTVFMYDVITGRSQMLPCMKRKRRGCTAVLTGDVAVVMGGRDENLEYLKSVECFNLERHVWQDLPDMIEPRAFATAVVKPND